MSDDTGLFPKDLFHELIVNLWIYLFYEFYPGCHQLSIWVAHRVRGARSWGAEDRCCAPLSLIHLKEIWNIVPCRDRLLRKLIYKPIPTHCYFTSWNIPCSVYHNENSQKVPSCRALTVSHIYSLTPPSHSELRITQNLKIYTHILYICLMKMRQFKFNY